MHTRSPQVDPLNEEVNRAIGEHIVKEATRKMRRKKIWKSIIKAIGDAFTVLVDVAFKGSLRGFAFMWGVQVVHDLWLPKLPYIGFLASFALMCTLAVLFPALFTQSRKSNVVIHRES